MKTSGLIIVIKVWVDLLRRRIAQLIRVGHEKLPQFPVGAR